MGWMLDVRLSSFDTPLYAVEPVHAFHPGVLSSDAGPRHCAPPMLTRL